MDNLGKSTELLELKFIQRAESCQIHRHGSNLLASLLATSNQKLIAELTAKNRVPSIYVREDYVNSGGLMSYGADRDELFRRGAIYVDKILKAAKPADLPVEQPTKFELVINLKTAKQIGVTIPQRVLARADKVIK